MRYWLIYSSSNDLYLILDTERGKSSLTWNTLSSIFTVRISDSSSFEEVELPKTLDGTYTKLAEFSALPSYEEFILEYPELCI